MACVSVSCQFWSHPSWVCGLKLVGRAQIAYNCQSHPSWVCGLKRRYCGNASLRFQSHPSWVCGLKQQKRADKFAAVGVTPFVGVWIETRSPPKACRSSQVTPFVGVWIETSFCWAVAPSCASHPSWVCGLKLSPWAMLRAGEGHTLRGCVD